MWFLHYSGLGPVGHYTGTIRSPQQGGAVSETASTEEWSLNYSHSFVPTLSRHSISECILNEEGKEEGSHRQPSDYNLASLWLPVRRESADKESLPPTVNISSYTVTNEQRKVVQGSVTRSWFPSVSNNLWIGHEVMRARLWEHSVTWRGRHGVRADSSPQDSTSLSSHP